MMEGVWCVVKDDTAVVMCWVLGELFRGAVNERWVL